MFLSEVEVRSVPTAPQCDQWEKGGGRGLVGWLIGGGQRGRGGDIGRTEGHQREPHSFSSSHSLLAHIPAPVTLIPAAHPGLLGRPIQALPKALGALGQTSLLPATTTTGWGEGTARRPQQPPHPVWAPWAALRAPHPSKERGRPWPWGPAGKPTAPSRAADPKPEAGSSLGKFQPQGTLQPPQAPTDSPQHPAPPEGPSPHPGPSLQLSMWLEPRAGKQPGRAQLEAQGGPWRPPQGGRPLPILSSPPPAPCTSSASPSESAGSPEAISEVCLPPSPDFRPSGMLRT